MSKISKLGLGIVAFDGNEHLKNITFELRSYCDLITVCLQKKSYHGDDILDSDVKVVEDLLERGFIDSIIWFEPTNEHAEEKVTENIPRLYETDKRNFILDYLEENGCSHSMVIDSDEFYDGVDFKRGYDAINADENIHVTYCQYVNYYRDYKHIMVWPFECYVPFISESSYRFDFEKGNFGKPSDPTRRYFMPEENAAYAILSFEAVKMHHLSWIRIDIERKLDAWSAKKLFKEYDKLSNAILERYYNYKDGENAIIMFNVPDNNVVVNKLRKQYIHPRFRIDEKVTISLKSTTHELKIRGFGGNTKPKVD